ncbi:MAG TPA: LLM class F420-dependent oxidoreductase [Solirubrobacteraceae bacterium]|jgi:probable F420-dependent oxidoreductase
MGGSLRIGVIFPQTELGGDRGAVRAYAEAVTELGYDHILAFDHVLGADPDVYRGWQVPYDVDSTFHEPLVLFGYLAAITPLELVCGILILPQRQTALVAKQAAEVDVLSDGRLRLGVGLGWNPVEYEALGKDFSNRGARIAEQVQLLRSLWTERSVTFEGTYEKVTGAGIAPLPIQRPIPIWFGGTHLTAVRRAGRVADGWFPRMPPGPELEEALAALHEGAGEAGRDPASIGVEGRIPVRPDAIEELAGTVSAWRELGASHVTLDTMRRGLRTAEDHIAALTAAAAVIRR